MKTFLAILFDSVHTKKNNNNNDNNSNDDDSSSATEDDDSEEVASFLSAESLRSFLRIDDLHDLIINHIAPQVTVIGEFGRLICGIIQDQESADLFSNIESFSAILKCFHRSKTSQDAQRIASSINNILFYNPSSNKLLNSLPVVEAFSFIIPLASDAEAVRWISNALEKILDNNEEAQEKFATREFLTILRGMEQHATTSLSLLSFRPVLDLVRLMTVVTEDDRSAISFLRNASTSSQLKSAVDCLPHHEKHFTAQVRDLLIAKKDLIVDAESANSVVKFLFSFSHAESLLPLLRTKEVHDLIIIHIAPHVTAIEGVGELICAIVRDQESVAFFSNVESFSAILKCFHRSKTSDDARWIASAMNNILTHNSSSNKILNSLPVVEAFSFIIPLANDDCAVRWISNALKNILDNNEEAQKKFATPEFLKIFQGMEKHVTTDDAKTQLQKVLNFLEPNQ
jgi:hypothetical protein